MKIRYAVFPVALKCSDGASSVVAPGTIVDSERHKIQIEYDPELEVVSALEPGESVPWMFGLGAVKGMKAYPIEEPKKAAKRGPTPDDAKP